MDMEELRGLLTIAQAARALGMSEGGVRRLISDGKLESTSLPGMTRPRLITREAIERFIRERKPRGRPRLSDTGTGAGAPGAVRTDV